MCTIGFDSGTITVSACEQLGPVPDYLLWDNRTGAFRMRACDYAKLVMTHVRRNLAYTDLAREYETLGTGLAVKRSPRDYQQEAVDAWAANRFQGMVVLPTGSGKTQVALMAIDRTRRSTLVVVPTLDLVRQWHQQLEHAFRVPVGRIGGGLHERLPITVTTYDSAYIHMENMGNKFGLVIFDECHHLPSQGYRLAAESCLAPFRLGLTATPERADQGDIHYAELIGPTVYRKEISELAGEFLSDYETHQVHVDLEPKERLSYEENRAVYRGFIREQGIRMSSPGGWQDFIMRAARSEGGRLAMKAYQEQKRLAYAAPSKLRYLEHLLAIHRNQQTLVFTQDNSTAYTISRRFLVPVITHQTKLKERTEILGGFSGGKYSVVATSKVLNEGVDVPNAAVAIILSGSGSIREHVQRLGRILRPGEGKKAVLYELISADTVEQYTSQRRREHNAYR